MSAAAVHVKVMSCQKTSLVFMKNKMQMRKEIDLYQQSVSRMALLTSAFSDDVTLSKQKSKSNAIKLNDS